eukprot:5672530-Pleurochrysis_carterae.AAC.1
MPACCCGVLRSFNIHALSVPDPFTDGCTNQQQHLLPPNQVHFSGASLCCGTPDSGVCGSCVCDAEVPVCSLSCSLAVSELA